MRAVQHYADIRPALDAVHATLAELGVNESDYTSETHTGSVLAARKGG